jgi:hypothetical protein
MLAVAYSGFSDLSYATTVAAYIRNRYLGNKSTTTSGISFGWLAVASNFATIATAATFGPDKAGEYKIRARKATAKTASPTRKAPAKASESRNGEVIVTRKSDAELAASVAAANDKPSA